MKKLIHWYDLSDHTVIKIEKDYQIRLLSLLKSKFMKQKEENNSYTSALIVLTSLFFMWGIHSLER